jgi:DNA excision repair protein ERCC-2
MKTLQLAITEFAIPSPRRGSIEPNSGFGGLPNVGGDIHLQIQLARTKTHPGYQPEKRVFHTFDTPKYKIQLSGRMDGFLFGPPNWIEEIKSTYDLEGLHQLLQNNPHHPYALQIRTYGYLQYLSSGYTPLLNLHLVCARRRTAIDLPVELALNDYETWLKARLNEICEEQKAFETAKAKRLKISTQMTFPFSEPRPKQNELVDLIETHLAKSTARLMVQAPTGLGKTAGVFFPALKDALARGQKTLYVTPKNSQHELAEDTLLRLRDQGAKIRSLTIQSKAKMCFKDEPHCDPKVCEFAKDHYSKLTEKGVAEKLRKKRAITSDVVRDVARENEVCPYDLQFEALPFVDAIICDYNYVFSPRQSIDKLTRNGYSPVTKKDLPNLVIDEAHNLPQRACDYFSAQLSSQELYLLAVQVPLEFQPLAFQTVELLKETCGKVADLNRRTQAHVVRMQPEDIGELSSCAQELLSRYLASNHALRNQDPVVKIHQMVTQFAQALLVNGEEFFVSFTPQGDGGMLKYTCCDAANFLSETYDHFANVVAFSATLKPFEFYAKLMGLKSEKLVTAEFSSPFPAEHRKVLIIPQISTKYRDREMNAGKIKQAIERIVRLRPGNYFVFFPSFDFLGQVLSKVEVPEFRVIAQTRDMRKEAVTQLLEKLKEPEPTLIFAVQGGLLAEGLDYPGDMIIGAFIVGPALPTFDFERERLREYFDSKYGDGFDFAYTYPAMARVVQSAGRVIRSSDDRGLIVLMDRRFLQDAFKKAMPQEWLSTDASLVSQQILEDVTQFWRESSP